ncbi:hypothetical protein Gogos_014410 [Gossypium gossypioides]|uniref:Uncharacterized protein n=1 Tax=Gossypium gossypioides TaxID=34282 RepID=A0A7J9BYH8_GOSGO|nr:hypothetical protein [Gossypium gossypioides]
MGNESRMKSTDIQVKPLSRHESSASSSSSSSYSQNLEKSQLNQSSTATEQTPGNRMDAQQTSAVYVPDRIPPSIFSSKPATPTDWSNASNESLFSIHVGNNSFSTDQFLTLYKSGELTKLDEQIIAQCGVLPSLKELDDMAEREDENIGKKEMPTTGIRTKQVAQDNGYRYGSGNQTHEPKFPAEAHNSPKSSVSRRSDESTLSFAFPVLNGTDGGRLSSVNSYQNNRGFKIQSVKQQQQQVQEPKQYAEEVKPKAQGTPQNASGRSWFAWFHCCRYP